MKDVYVKMRTTREERDLVIKLANKRGLNVSDYLRHLITTDQIKNGGEK